LAYNRNIQQSVLVVELSTGQMVEDVRLATKDRVPVQLSAKAKNSAMRDLNIRALTAAARAALSN
jgi:hypothetical protein